MYVAGWALTLVGLGAAVTGALSGAQGAGVVVLLVGGLLALTLGLIAAAGAQGLQRAADGTSGYAGPSPFLVFAAAFMASLVVQLVVLLVVGDRMSTAVAVLVSVLISATTALGLVRLLVVDPGALTWREMGARLPRPGEGAPLSDVAWGVLLAVPVLVLAGLLAALLTSISGVTPEAPLPVTPGVAPDVANTAIALFAAVVIAPVWEETFFRGFVTTAWSRARSQRWALVGGAVFFAAIHVLTLTSGDTFEVAATQAFIAFAIRIPVGLALGWIFLRRRTLLAPIVLHAAYNGLPLLLALAYGSGIG